MCPDQRHVTDKWDVGDARLIDKRCVFFMLGLLLSCGRWKLELLHLFAVTSSLLKALEVRVSRHETEGWKHYFIFFETL